MRVFKYKRVQQFVYQATAIFLLLFGLVFQAKAQVVFTESFDNPGIPTAWSIDQQSANWSVSSTQFAGGNSPEIKFSGSPSFYNFSRLLSPSIDLTAASLAKIEFTYSVDHLNAGYSIGLAARNNQGQWNIIWSKVPISSIAATTQTVVINYPGFNTNDFQFAFYFQGNSQNINSFYIDNVKLYIPALHDLALNAIINPEVQLPNANLIPQVLISNNGQLSETYFSVFCRLYDGNNNLVYNNQQVVTQLAGAEVDTISFPAYILTLANDFYRIEANVALYDDQLASNDTLEKGIKTLTLVDRKFVMTEMATATWCVSCPATTQAVHDLLLAGKQMAVAEYHSPSGDIFTNSDASERLNYYNVIGYPTAYFDGILSYIGSPNASTEYQNQYNQRMAVPTPFDIKIYGTHTGTQYNLNVILYRMAPVLHDNIVLRVVLTESGIPYNWLGQTQLDHVERLMIPDADGYHVDLVNHTQLNIPLSFTMNPNWNQQNCEIIAFLQDTVTKEILQANKRTYYELVPMGFQKIQGYVRYKNSANTPLAGVTVKLRLGGGVVATTTSAANGYYSFTGIAPGSYYLSCSYNGSWGGGNAADALHVMKYFTSLEIPDALQFKAADNDVSNYINTADALSIMRRFVGLSTKFNQADWVFDNPLINLPNSTIVNQNIKGLCTGDVNGTYIP